MSVSASVNFPAPSDDGMAHSEELAKRIRSAISAQGGIIDFASYMQYVLYEPGYGYYTAGATKFGGAGDFITAPEISPLFGRSIAQQCFDVLCSIPQSVILEVGAGSGKLARDILLELSHLKVMPERYLIIETSADLKSKQQELLKAALPDFYKRIYWLEQWPKAPVSGVVVANELLDAMPVHRLRQQESRLIELGVTENGKAFGYSPMAGHTLAVERLQAKLNEAGVSLTEGTDTEICLMHDAWVASLSRCLNQGLVLLVDYGYSRKDYYHPQRVDGTLRCHYRHIAHDNPFFYPGLQDLTAHVDFTAIAESAVDSGFDVLGYTTQAYFLLSCGITELVDMEHLDDLQRIDVAQQIRKLTMPGEMGEPFKTIALGKDLDIGLKGFSMNDQRENL